ncbi:MAG: hypothetical protein BWK76_05815 [Desulfobulbaceae bacterium A2]|nr:MAG: hypothetical protein BWK76_05815 [Desulfobulbaceae bacterium A2]
MLCAAVAGAADAFPVPARIAANVAFWEKVYGQYSINETVLHDRQNLGIIYGTIEMERADVPGAAERNRQQVQAEINRISSLLRGLADGATPSTPRERQVAALFAGQSPVALRQAADNIRAQGGLKERFLQGVRRSGAYIKEFRRMFAAAGLPQELAYLPHVESSFDSDARSKAGAVGLWQFTSDTGRCYLAVNALVDERLDPWRSSYAAVRYLKESHDALGDWPLALTSYNYGRAGMIRAKQALGSYERIFAEYNGGHFKFAARNFYPEFLAALRVARRLEADPTVARDRPRSTTTRELSQGLTIIEAAQRYGISRNELIELNPALLATVVSGQRAIPRGYALRLPAAASGTAVAAAGPKAPAPQVLVTEQQSKERHAGDQKMVRYQVRQGDTVTSIAKRHNVGKETLMAANKLSREATIQVGQYLNIPSTLTAKNDSTDRRQ